MKKEYVLALIVLGIVGIAAYAVATRETEPEQAIQPTPEPVVVPEDTASVEAYVRENISSLSPEPEVLGGTFYVTAFDAENGSGTVSYEDGHNAYTADFRYTTDQAGQVTVTSFTTR